MIFETAEKFSGIDKVKLGIALLSVVLVLAGAFGAGWVVNGWRLEAAHAVELSEKQAIISDLTGKIVTQNHAVDILAEKRANATSRRELAVQLSKDVLASLRNRDAAVAASQAVDCDGVLREDWERGK